jgi:hypothetical protein
MFLLAVASALVLAFFVTSCLMVLGSRKQYKEAEAIVARTEDRIWKTDGPGGTADRLLAVENELSRRKESHERVVAILIEERDRWRKQAKEHEESFDGTMNYYQRTISRLAQAKARKVDDIEMQDIMSHIKKFEEECRRARGLPVSEAAEVEKAQGYEAKTEERKALCLGS